MEGDAPPPLLSAADLRELERLRPARLGAILAGAAGRPAARPGGRGVDFAEFRPYVPGDDVRLIDANAYARLRQAFVKIAPEERDTGLLVLIDGSRSIARPGGASRRHADRLAALLGAVALLRGDGLQTAILADGGAEVGPLLRGPSALWSLVDQLQRLPRGRATDLAGGIRAARGAVAATDLVVLITDALVEPPALDEALAELARAGRAAALLHLIEAAPPDAGAGWVELVDAETGETATIAMTPRVRAGYRERLDALVARVREAAEGAGVGVTALAVEEPALDQVVALGRAGELLTRAH